MVTPPVSLTQAARVSMERWFEMPQEAAGPDVTPTKPILSTGLAAQAALATVSEAKLANAVVFKKLRFFMLRVFLKGH